MDSRWEPVPRIYSYCHPGEILRGVCVDRPGQNLPYLCFWVDVKKRLVEGISPALCLREIRPRVHVVPNLPGSLSRVDVKKCPLQRIYPERQAGKILRRVGLAQNLLDSHPCGDSGKSVLFPVFHSLATGEIPGFPGRLYRLSYLRLWGDSLEGCALFVFLFHQSVEMRLEGVK